MGPAIDVGTEMTATIMKGNGEVVYRSTYHGLKGDECINQDHISLRKEFVSNTKDRFGTDISPDNFTDVNLEDTPLYEMYEDDTTDVSGGLAGNTEDYDDPDMATGLDCEVPTPEVNENYVNASVMLPRGKSYVREKFTGQKKDADGNAVGRTNDTPIIYTREYHVEFDDGEVSELTEIMIAESMYAA